MQLTKTIETVANERAVDVLAETNGVPPETVRQAIAAAVPELAFQLEGNTLSRGGLADLVAALGYGHHEGYLNDPSMLASPAAREDGHAILKHILGSDEAVQRVEGRIARLSGADRQTIAKMLPQIAGMTMGAVVHDTKAQFGDIFSQISRTTEPRRSEPAGGDTTLPQQMPLPVPQDVPETGGAEWGHGKARPRSPFDDLSDVIRRRGRTPSGDRQLGSVVRDILGQVLGSRRGGVMTWIIRFVLFRLAWPILKRIFMRALLGR